MLHRRMLVVLLFVTLVVLTSCGGGPKQVHTYRIQERTLVSRHQIDNPAANLITLNVLARRKSIKQHRDVQLVLDVQLVHNVQLLNDTKKWQTTVASRSASRSSSIPRTYPPTIGGRIPYDYAKWIRVHICEQGETWHAGGHFGNGLPAGGNGLGFSLYAWRDAVGYAAARGVIIPASGWDASPDQQMQAAQAMLDATGGGPDCL